MLRGLDEYNCTVGTNSFNRFTLNAPVSSTWAPPTTEIGIGTFCADSTRLLAVIISSVNSVFVKRTIVNTESLISAISTSAGANPTEETVRIKGNAFGEGIENSPFGSATLKMFVPLTETEAASTGTPFHL